MRQSGHQIRGHFNIHNWCEECKDKMRDFLSCTPVSTIVSVDCSMSLYTHSPYRYGTLDTPRASSHYSSNLMPLGVKSIAPPL